MAEYSIEPLQCRRAGNTVFFAYGKENAYFSVYDDKEKVNVTLKDVFMRQKFRNISCFCLLLLKRGSRCSFTTSITN